MSVDATTDNEKLVEGAPAAANTKLDRFVQFFDGGWEQEGAYGGKKYDLSFYFLCLQFKPLSSDLCAILV